MTEAEAKTKWCPFARDSETAGNRSILTPDDIRFPCIASACMAWRHDVGSRVWRLNKDGSKAYSFAVPDTRPFESDREFSVDAPGAAGHCGLAGAVR